MVPKGRSLSKSSRISIQKIGEIGFVPFVPLLCKFMMTLSFTAFLGWLKISCVWNCSVCTVALLIFDGWNFIAFLCLLQKKGESGIVPFALLLCKCMMTENFDAFLRSLKIRWVWNCSVPFVPLYSKFMMAGILPLFSVRYKKR